MRISHALRQDRCFLGPTQTAWLGAHGKVIGYPNYPAACRR
jgi:hypothetical protein